MPLLEWVKTEELYLGSYSILESVATNVRKRVEGWNLINISNKNILE